MLQGNKNALLRGSSALVLSPSFLLLAGSCERYRYHPPLHLLSSFLLSNICVWFWFGCNRRWLRSCCSPSHRLCFSPRVTEGRCEVTVRRVFTNRFSPAASQRRFV